MFNTVRKIQLPDDYASIVQLLNDILSEPTTIENLTEEDRKIPSVGSLYRNEDGLLSGHDRERLVIVDSKQQVRGYGISWRAPWTAAGELNQTLVIDPAYRKTGLGTELYATLEEWAVQNAASKLNIVVQDDDVNSIAFATKMGYEMERHTFESVLNLANFNREACPSASCPYDIIALSDLTEPDREEKLYELYRETNVDVPGASGDFFDLHEWKKWTLELPGSKPEYVLIARDGDKMIGVAHLLYHEATQSMYHEYTGVKKEYRGQGIGLALKLRTIELALHHQITYLRTHNDSLNKPMLRINRDHLGFEAVPGHYKMVKRLS
ncbi:GNAT family N-acetyltransferase [Paenibacillus sp. 1001270B_150601_E10]|uniref:GNAT family N-acetyltransferase n=1 Tax=Paenibacillus sp. 1001270B_150601_E10 TaxID=2787079 RepID=UPI0018A054BF|nr:GNAT family N-acetyltransferase [Paenibacillus sp. 1001270B_150601_E10]